MTETEEQEIYRQTTVSTTTGDTVTVQFTPEPTRAGYVFAGWAASATAATADYTQGGTTSFAMGTENVTLYAVWSEIDRAVIYNANGATGGSAPEDTTPYSAGVTVTVLGNTGSLEKTGYTFTGWSTESDATEADYVVGESLTAADRVTLYAVWVPYTYTSNGTAITLTGYTGTETIVTVPETIAKLPGNSDWIKCICRKGSNSSNAAVKPDEHVKLCIPKLQCPDIHRHTGWSYTTIQLFICRLLGINYS